MGRASLAKDGMSHHAAASSTFAFDARLGACDPDLQSLLKNKVTVKPAAIVHLSRDAPGSDEATAAFRS